MSDNTSTSNPIANTNQNDSFLFGPTPDPNYFKAAYQALADAGVRAINNSWGSQPKDVSYETLDGLHAAYAQHYGRSTWLDAAAAGAGYVIERTTIEAHGRCPACR